MNYEAALLGTPVRIFKPGEALAEAAANADSEDSAYADYCARLEAQNAVVCGFIADVERHFSRIHDLRDEDYRAEVVKRNARQAARDLEEYERSRGMRRQKSIDFPFQLPKAIVSEIGDAPSIRRSNREFLRSRAGAFWPIAYFASVLLPIDRMRTLKKRLRRAAR
jgi:hypothetical protein